jgi:hypothetical protein
MDTEKTPIPGRPPESSVAVHLKVAQRLAPRLKKWLSAYDENPTTEGEIVEELVKAFSHCWDYDGHKLANRLSWDGDSELVEILDDTAHMMRSAHNELVEEWVKTAEIKPLFKVYDPCFVIAERKYRADKGVQHVGEIVEVDAKLARYVVCIRALGHKNPKVEEMVSGTIGIVYNFEEVSPPAELKET